MLETRSRKARHTQEEMTRWTSVRLAKARANKAKASTARAMAMAQRSKDSKDNKDRTKSKDGFDRMLELWKARTQLERLLEQEGPDQHRWFSKGKHKAKNATDAHNLDSAKPANSEPEVEIGGFDMNHLDADAVEVRQPEWMKIGVDTGTGKTA